MKTSTTLLALAVVCAALAVVAVSGIAVKTTTPARPPKWHELTPSYSFEQYVADQGKQDHYAELDAESLAMREELFTAQLKTVLEHNAKPGETWKMGINKFSDWTQEEKEGMLMQPPPLENVQDEASPKVPKQRSLSPEEMLARAGPKQRAHLDKMRRLGDPVSGFDYRDINPSVLTAVKDQGYCGSCWAFSTTEATETKWALANGYLNSLSVQNLVSCVPPFRVIQAPPNYTMGGCRGYLPIEAVKYLVGAGGQVRSEWNMPYTSYFINQVGMNPVAPCNTTARHGFARISGAEYVAQNDAGAHEAALLEHGPVVSLMYVPDSFAHYEAGVFQGSACINNTNMEPSHAVTIVGFGHDKELGVDYWAVRNSWTPNWGENGYFRLLKTTPPNCGGMPLPQREDAHNWTQQTACGTCGILSFSMYPLVPAM